MIGKMPIGGGRNEAIMPDPFDDQRGQHAALRIEDQIEMTPPQWTRHQQLPPAVADVRVFDDLVHQAFDQGGEGTGVDRPAFSGQPGNACGRVGGTQGAQERKLHQAIADQIEADEDKDGLGQVGHGSERMVEDGVKVTIRGAQGNRRLAALILPRSHPTCRGRMAPGEWSALAGIPRRRYCEGRPSAAFPLLSSVFRPCRFALACSLPP